MNKLIEALKLNKMKMISFIVAIVLLLVELFSIFCLQFYIPFNFLLFSIVAVLIIGFSLIIGSLKIPKIILGIEIIICICLIIAGFGIYKFIGFANTITKTNEVETVQIVAHKDANISIKSDFKKLSMAYTQDDADAYKKGAKILKENDKIIGKEKPFKTTKVAYEDLQNGKVDLMVVTNMTQSELSEIDENYVDKIKVIFSKNYELDSAIIKKVDMTKEPFTIYIQGTDLSSGKNINSTGRGDVNILLTVNPNTKKVNMQVVPRDLFVYIPSKDASSKLSYSGWWGGVQSSISSIEKALGITINYYAKLNFTGLIKLVDALDGVQVYSHYTYKAKEYNFVKGYNEVNGEKALMFARARKMLPLNERSRGYQQMELIKGIFTKFSQQPTLQHGMNVLDSLEDNFTTNIPQKYFINVFNLVMDVMPQLKMMDIHSMEGEYKWHMDEVMKNDYLYYFYPVKNEVETARERIQDILSEN